MRLTTGQTITLSPVRFEREGELIPRIFYTVALVDEPTPIPFAHSSLDTENLGSTSG